MKKTLLIERFQELAGIKPLSEQPDDLERLGSTMAKGFDDRLAQQMGMSNDEFEDQVASRDIGQGVDNTKGLFKVGIINDIFDLINVNQIDPMEVMEAIGEEFDIKIEFIGGAPGFKQAGEDEMHDDPGDIRIDHDYYT